MPKRLRELLGESSDLNPRNMRLGMYAWLIQRMSGLYLLFFLLAHIAAIAQANFVVSTGSTVLMFRNPFWAGGTATVIFDFVALAIIAFHGLNGVRIVFLDLGLGVRKHRLAFWFTMMIAVAVTALVIALALLMLSGRV